MAEMLQFDLVSPERKLASVQAREVQIPGADGDMTAMAEHAPTITTLRPGILRVVHGSGADEYVVSGGFAEITPEGVSVLAEQALPKDEVSQDAFNGMLEGAREAHEIAKSDDSAKVLSDLQAVAAQLGLTAG